MRTLEHDAVAPENVVINIRLARVEDIPTLNTLIALSARTLSQDVYSEAEIEAAIKHVFGVDSELLHDKTYFVVEKNRQIAGCGGWSKRKTLFGGNQYVGREEPVYLDPRQEAAKIRAFFIHPQFARQGLGSALLEHCEREAAKQGFTRFEMMATLPGVKLYQALSYEAVAEETVVLPCKTALRFVRMVKEGAP